MPFDEKIAALDQGAFDALYTQTVDAMGVLLKRVDAGEVAFAAAQPDLVEFVAQLQALGVERQKRAVAEFGAA